MTSKKRPLKTTALPASFDQARDELFSHILRCGVIEAEPEHQKEWMDDTMQYLAERYGDLTEEQLSQVRVLGERFCRPVVARRPEVASTTSE
jgi:hypothetical protein